MRRLTLLLSLPSLLLTAGPSIREMSLKAPDGQVLSGTLVVPEGRRRHPAVILVHPFRGDRTNWDELADKLHARGLATLALDLRGHGRSTEGGATAIAASNMTAAEATGFDRVPADLALAAGWLRKQAGIDSRHLGLAGAGEGAFAVLTASSRIRPSVILALSPSGTDAFGPDARRSMAASVERSHSAVMTFSAIGDGEAEENVAPLRPLFGSNIRTFEGGQRGLEYVPHYGDTMAVFFAEYLLHPHTGRGAVAAPQAPATPGTTVLTPQAAQPSNP